jgi:hypothetical protein
VNGNWGTVDIGDDNNSTAEIRDQVLNGLQQSDLDALYEEYRIPTNTHIDSLVPFDANAETGFSTGMKHAINAVIGKTRLVPLYDDVGGGGDGAEFHIVGWGVAEVVGAYWQGSKLSHVDIKKMYTYDRLLKPQTDLSITVGVIEGAFTTPVLVE